MEEIRKYFKGKTESGKIANSAKLTLPASKWLQEADTIYNQARSEFAQDEEMVNQKLALRSSFIEIVLPYMEIDTYMSLEYSVDVINNKEGNLDSILHAYYQSVQSVVHPLTLMIELTRSPEYIVALYIRAILDYLDKDVDKVVHKANLVAMIALYETFHQEITQYLKKQRDRHLSIQVNKENPHLFPMRRTVKEYQIKCIQLLGYVDWGVGYSPARKFNDLWKYSLNRHAAIPNTIEETQFQKHIAQCQKVEDELDMTITKAQFLDSFEYYMKDATIPVLNRIRSNDMYGVYLKDKDQKLNVKSLLIGLFDYIWEEPIKFLFVAITIYESFKQSPDDKTLQKLATSVYYLVEKYQGILQEIIEKNIGEKTSFFYIISCESSNKEYQDLALTSTKNEEAYNRWAKR